MSKHWSNLWGPDLTDVSAICEGRIWSAVLEAHVAHAFTALVAHGRVSGLCQLAHECNVLPLSDMQYICSYVQHEYENEMYVSVIQKRGLSGQDE